MQQRVHTCDSCDRTAVDATRRELEKDGWVFHALKNKLWVVFVVCGDCETYYAERRKTKIAA